MLGCSFKPCCHKRSHRCPGAASGVHQWKRTQATCNRPGTRTRAVDAPDNAPCTSTAPCSEAPGLMASRRTMLTGIALGAAAAANPAGQPQPAAAAQTTSAAASVAEPALAATSRGACTLPTASAYQALRDPLINRGLAMSGAERQLYGLGALLPPGQASTDVEVARAQAAIDRACTPLEKYQVIATLAETDQHTCYTLLRQDLARYLPVVYTPTVGDACLSWGSLLPRPTGLYLSARRDAGRVRQLLSTWPCRQVRIAVITDGERILGLGDLGAHGMGIPTGKAMVYGACGLEPTSVLPVLVDAGCNTAAVRNNLLYVGEREQRLRGDAYFSFMDEVVQGIQDTWGGNVLIHWEDVGSSNSFKLLDRLRDRASPVPTFNDDIECTAVVTLATLLAAPRLTGLALAQQTFLFFGAGQANLGCAELLQQCLQQQYGLTAKEARSKIWLYDSQGVVLDERPGLSAQKRRFSQPASRLEGLLQRHGKALAQMSTNGLGADTLETAVEVIRPTALIGAASVGGAFNQQVLSKLDVGVQAAYGPGARPLVLALSNPTSRAECTYAQAFEWSQGRAVFASGTQFPSLTTPEGQVRTPAQANNCYVFPGLGLGCVNSKAERVTPNMLLAAASAIAGLLGEEEMTEECLLPRLSRLPEVTQVVAAAVQQAAELDGVAGA